MNMDTDKTTEDEPVYFSDIENEAVIVNQANIPTVECRKRPANHRQAYE